MYVIKNAFKCIGRAKSRNLLIGVIVFVLAASACIGLSIRQAAENAKETTLEQLSVTATISFDRQSMMSGMKSPQEGASSGEPSSHSFDREQFAESMNKAQSLTLEEYETYAGAQSVEDFYYTLTAYCNGSDGFEPVTTETQEEETDQNFPSSENPFGESGKNNSFGGMMNRPMGGKGQMMAGVNTDSDFTLVGYSADEAMTDFASGVATVTSGSIFPEQTEEYTCVISSELATFNNLAVGDTVTFTNANAEDETYAFTVCGIYETSSANEFTGAMFGANRDPANMVYMSAAALQKVMDASSKISQTVTDETTGREYETAITGQVNATYVFADTDAYYQFEEQARALGLSDSYTVSSRDIAAFESSLTPLNTLSTMAGWFLLVILIIGGVILMVLNIFNVRERKYEIGVLTAMGMKKRKVALQFICEIFVVTMLAVTIGAGVGAVSSVPVTNALLQNQVESQQETQTQMEQNFGRPGSIGGQMQTSPDMGAQSQGKPLKDMMDKATNYITEIDSAVNGTVLLQMMGIGILLTIVAGGVAVLFVMRYNPLKILANRD